jgi:hypothetical protein
VEERVDTYESISLAFLVLLEHLQPIERAVAPCAGLTQMLDKSSPFLYNESRMEAQERIQRHHLAQKEQGTHVYS